MSLAHRDSALATAVSELRISNGIVIVGAGASYDAGMPLAGQLAPLVWHTLDENTTVQRKIAAALGVPEGPARFMIGDHWDRIARAFEHISVDTQARSHFQTTFARLNEDRTSQFSPAHDMLARLVHARIIEHVISLNWDTLVESAYFARYGVSINANRVRLVKPHGDALDVHADWVLPNEPGSISDELIRTIREFVVDRPRVLLVVGYSERDAVIIDRLIRPLTSRWRVLRVGPHVTGDGAIRVSAVEALTYLADHLCPEPEVPGWDYVTFANQRGIASAIKGERLGPADVESCPRLPQVRNVRRDLDVLHYAVINGPPGCGKSITAYQVANDLRKDGWEVLRLKHAVVSEDAAILAARNAPTDKILLVDDAQTLSHDFAHRLIELANSGTNVLIALTERNSGDPHAISISSSAAVETLSQAYLERRDEVLAVVSRFDDWVSDRYLDTPLERRIEDARKSKTPWQFNFVLRGGWRGARAELDVLRDLDRTDLLLLIIAALQIATLDGSIAPAALDSYLPRARRDWQWRDAALDVLRRRYVLLASEELRCPHIRFASVVIECWFSHYRDPEFDCAVDVMRTILLAPDTPLQGISWLLHELSSTDAHRLGRINSLLHVDDYSVLVSRCLNSVGAVERRDACFAMSALMGWSNVCCTEVTKHFGVLSRWIEEPEDASVGGLSVLIRAFWHDDREQKDSHHASELLSGANPEQIAKRLKGASHSSGYGWSEFLSWSWRAAEPSWRARFLAAIDCDHLWHFVESFGASQLFHLAKFLYGLCYFDEELAFSALDRALPVIRAGLEANPLDGWENLQDVIWHMLGHCPKFLRHRKPDKRQRSYSRQIARCLPIERIATEISSSRQRDWERYASMVGEWLSEVDRRRYSQIVRLVDVNRLNARTAGMWSRLPRELRLLVVTLSEAKDGEPGRSWVASHKDELENLDPLTVWVAPEVAVEVLKRGGHVNLAGHNARDWGLQAHALARIARVDPSEARRVADENEPHLVACVSKLEGIDCGDGLLTYFRVLEELCAELPQRVMDQVDPVEASKRWKSVLRDKRAKVKRAVAGLVKIAKRCSGPISDVARDVEKDIPRRMLPTDDGS